MQQWKYYRKKGTENPDPHILFTNALRHCLESQLDNDHEVVLLLDANENLKVGSPLLSMLSDLNLLNVHAHLHPALSPPATYQRGSDCIDYMFISPGLIPALTKA
eukprot:10668818-Ditylum_brightwellii.AAC.1